MDQDGSPADFDCDDNDPFRFPGNPEVRDGKDNNCNDVADEGLAGPDAGPSDAGSLSGACPEAGIARPCGAAGSDCRQACEPSSEGPTWGPCKTGQDLAPELENDPDNCGLCGRVCPPLMHAKRLCKEVCKPSETGPDCRPDCVRGACEPGYFDFDGESTPGCEAQCAGTRCTNGYQTWTLTSEPLQDRGVVFHVIAPSGSFGSLLQTNARYTNFATLGEPTPPLEGGEVESRSASHINQAGFGAALRRP